jgi:aryl-alcohol dehydrogenase-like predicted oxidoreductase
MHRGAHGCDDAIDDRTWVDDAERWSSTVDRVTLGRSGLRVSPISLATWPLAGAADARNIEATVAVARELGVNLFDTSAAWDGGATDSVLGAALHDELRDGREGIVVAVEAGLRREGDELVTDTRADSIRQDVDQSLAALSIDEIDLLQVPWPDPCTATSEVVDEVEALVDEGKVRHAGVSLLDGQPFEPAFAEGPIETVQTPSLVFRPAAQGLWLPYARLHDLGVLVGGPLVDGPVGLDLGPAAFFTRARPPVVTAAGGEWRPGLRRPARGAANGPPGLRPEYGFGRPRYATPDRALHQRAVVMAGLKRIAADVGTSVGDLLIAWTLLQPGVHVAIVGAGAPDPLGETIRAVDRNLCAVDIATIDDVLRAADRAA